jgi:hypothetical protein
MSSGVTRRVVVNCGAGSANVSRGSAWVTGLSPSGSLLLTSVYPIPTGSENYFFDASCESGPGYAEVYSSTQPDPDSTPNNAVATEDDYVVIPQSAPA